MVLRGDTKYHRLFLPIHREHACATYYNRDGCIVSDIDLRDAAIDIATMGSNCVATHIPFVLALWLYLAEAAAMAAQSVTNTVTRP
jgi:hypothetical protein